MIQKLLLYSSILWQLLLQLLTRLWSDTQEKSLTKFMMLVSEQWSWASYPCHREVTKHALGSSGQTLVGTR